jgi:hypothetical protein
MMSLELLNVNKMSPTLKEYTSRFSGVEFNKNHLLLSMFFAPIYAIMSYLIYMKMYTDIVTNVIYCLFVFQFIGTVIIIASIAMMIFAIYSDKKDIAASLNFKKMSIWNKLFNYINTICYYTYVASLLTTNHPFILVSLVFCIFVVWLLTKIGKEIYTTELNELTEDEIDKIEELRARKLIQKNLYN